jgi:SAM-dependent methyltransferase
MNPKKLSFDTSYLTWKKWHSENFGILRKTDERYFSAELSRIPRKISCESAILEIGFGNGSFLKYALNRGWTVTGLEMNAELHKCAKASGFRSYCGGSLGIFQDSEFDFIFAFDVLEHIPHDELIGYFTEIRRILKSGGFFLLASPMATLHLACIIKMVISHINLSLEAER